MGRPQTFCAEHGISRKSFHELRTRAVAERRHLGASGRVLYDTAIGHRQSAVASKWVKAATDPAQSQDRARDRRKMLTDVHLEAMWRSSHILDRQPPCMCGLLRSGVAAT